MMVEDDLGLEAKPLWWSAEGWGGSENVQISGAGEDGPPAPQGAGNEMGGF